MEWKVRARSNLSAATSLAVRPRWRPATCWASGVPYRSSPSCTHAVPAEIQLRAESRDNFAGEITVEATGGVEVWPIEVERFDDSGYQHDALANGFDGQFQELEAEFATAGDTVLRIDQAGLIFFQAPHSGCTGNGTLAPHR